MSALEADNETSLHELEAAKDELLSAHRDQFAVDSVHFMAPRLPHLEQILVAFLEGPEFAPDSMINLLPPAENGWNHHKIRNDTDSFAAAKLVTEEDSLYIMRLARVEDASGAMRELRDALLAFKQRAVEEARAKQKAKEDETLARTAELQSIRIIVDPKKLAALNKVLLRQLIDIRRELLKEDTIAKTKLKDMENKPDRLAAIIAPDEHTNDLFQNLFQCLYHLARLELGIIVENQIFNSPLMFNKSISTVYTPSIIATKFIVAANDSRASTSNTTLMKEWADIVHIFNTTDRVPVINYLRPVPHLKPLGSALTSVFVSTFAMVSVLWTVFSLVAGIIAARSEKGSTQGGFTPHTLEDRIDTYGVAIDTYGIDIAEIKLSLRSFKRTQLALKKRGLLEDDDEEGSLESSIACTSGQEEKSTLLVHRTQSDSYSAV
ncbi:hypothetical protein C8R46DRAFT_1219951 [Mycena filopes]|nr:hypothetical protein C8R46DRAFT_1219951 [Mycena filopes]